MSVHDACFNTCVNGLFPLLSSQVATETAVGGVFLKRGKFETKHGFHFKPVGKAAP